MYDGSAGFDLPSAVYLGDALAEAGYRWYEEPMREFSVTAYRWLAERVEVPLLVGETSDGSHLNTADFIASGCATYVRTSANHRGGITGAMRIAHLADSFRLRAEVHGPTEPAVHLCMAIPNCTYYESLVTSNPVAREPRVGPDGLVHAPTEPGHRASGRSSTRRAPQHTREGHESLDERSAHDGQASVARAGVARRGRDDDGRAGRCLNRRSELRKGRPARSPSGSTPSGLPVAKLYVKTHPNVKVNVVTYDGDGNGATTMQTKIQLWNRTGKGWPDVVFSEQANDPVWMSQPPFDFALNLKGVFPASLLKGWPAPSLAQCTVNGRLVCLQDNLAQEVLYVNKKLMGQFGYTVPTTWQEWAALGAKVAKEHPGYIIGNMGDSYSHWLYLWPDRCPISQVVAPKTVRINSANVQCTRMAHLLDPLIKSGVVPPGEHLHAGVRPEVRRRHRQDPAHARADLVREGHLRRDAEGAGRRDDGRDAAAVEQRAAHDRPGRRRPVDRLEAHEERGGRDRLREVRRRHRRTVKSKAGSRRGIPSYGPAANVWLKKLNKDPYFAAPPGAAMKAAAGLVWKGWSMVTYPDQPVWSTAVVTQLVAGKSLSDQLPALGEGLSNNAKAAGYKVVNK